MDFTDGFSEIFYIPEDGKMLFHDGTLAFSLGQIDEGEQKREIKYNRLERNNVNPLVEELSSFVDAIQNDRQPKVSAQEGLAALQREVRANGATNAHRTMR